MPQGGGLSVPQEEGLSMPPPHTPPSPSSLCIPFFSDLKTFYSLSLSSPHHLAQRHPLCAPPLTSLNAPPCCSPPHLAQRPTLCAPPLTSLNAPPCCSPPHLTQRPTLSSPPVTSLNAPPCVLAILPGALKEALRTMSADSMLSSTIQDLQVRGRCSHATPRTCR